MLGLVECKTNYCLYASDFNLHRLHRLDLSCSKPAMMWSVGSSPGGLSVNMNRNVIVACVGENTILEYTTLGSLVREICLQTVTGGGG